MRKKQFLLPAYHLPTFFLLFQLAGPARESAAKVYGLPSLSQHHKAMLKSRFGVSDNTLIKNICIYTKGKKQQQHWMHQHVNSGYYWMMWEDDEWFNSIDTFLHFLILLQKISHNSFLTLYRKADFWLKGC